MRSKARTAIALALALALALRLGLALGAPATRIAGDPTVYDEIGASIAAGHGWPRLNRHVKVEFASPEAKENVACEPATVPVGPAVIVVSGGLVSTVQPADAGDASALPARSTARTAKSWLFRAKNA